MKVKDIMTTHVVTVHADDSIVHAARAMRERHVGDVVVVEDTPSGRIPRGIVTDRDLVVGVLAVDPSNLAAFKVRDILGQGLVTTTPEADVLDVVADMERRAIRRLPVVNRLDALVGILTLDDVARALISRLSRLAQIAAFQPGDEALRRT